MSYTGFGVSSGPSAPPKFQPSFPSTPPPPSPVAAGSPFNPRLQSSPRTSETPELKQLHPLVFPNARPAVISPFSYDGSASYRKSENPEIRQSPPLVFPNARPAVNLPFSNDGNARRADQRWNTEQRAVPNYNNAQMLQRPSAVTHFSASNNFRPSIHAKNPQVQDLRRTRSPDNNFRNINQDVNGRPRLSRDYSDLWTSEEPSPVSPFVDPRESQKGYSTEQVGGVLKRTRSPPLPFASGVHKDSRFTGEATKRPSMSPPIQASSRSNVLFHTPGSEINQRFPPSMHTGGSEASDTKFGSFPAIKRTRSPPLSLSDQVFQGTSSSTQDETEREMQAKAKRAARFGVELSQPMPEAVSQKFPGNRHVHSMVENKDVEQSKEIVGDFPGSALPEDEGSEATNVIIGLCPDMCPETERAERERKGDLDHYERLGGDRNQTCRSMAVKKYTRTAEREAELIRPMPILRNTIDYLLNLLDQPYDDKFLGMYNFLWDRMRAIRMDLRMQHIFNLGAVAMLEQMIRLHIIAMHELCEYTKGEGFSEGFDAHLNIEQMNKTSVELFQMYDDHRKKGINIPSEKEFRGYYALLKLDKHPGYRVEPAELSLDLAKMTPEIRQTPEVLFARDVARACRTGNFIAFFRLARRASYLQACLMHAHFSKLRTQALASLHSGLQNNQGLPVSNVSKWLAIEEDDVQRLSDYHGFLLKDFEEPYMVKEGPFLNSEKDYATNCSKLVQLKRSRTISEDVASSSQEVFLPAEKERKPRQMVGYIGSYKRDPPTDEIVKMPSSSSVSDADMLDFPTVPSPKDPKQIQPASVPSFIQQAEDSHQMASVGFPTWNLFQVGSSPHTQSVKVNAMEKQNLEASVESPRNRSLHSDAKPMSLPISPVRNLQELSPVPSNWQELSPVPKFDISANTVSQNVAEDVEAEEPVDIYQEPEPDKSIELYHEKEAAEGKLRLILRIWKRRSSKKKELRMQRLLAANAAMNSLSLGPLIRQKRDVPSTFGEFNIDNVMRERYNKHGRSWSRLNVSDVVVDQLRKRNPEAKCICFKIVVCSHIDDTDRRASRVAASASSWLHSKLTPGKEDEHDGLVKSSPGLSIWKKWRGDQYSTDMTCCLSVIKDVKFDILNETVLGASAILYLVSESISWELQKTRLQSLVMSIPSYSRLPLLILTDSYSEALSSNLLIEKLGLSNFDDTRISGICVLPVVEDLQVGHLDGFFSDKQLREGLQWLASESPLQLVLNHVKTRELVMARLNSTLESFDETKVYEVGPNHCISALNETLDRTISEITETAILNSSSWPCPEINMLDKASAEHKACKMYLPSTGWSSATKIEPLVCALKESKLPGFPYDIPWFGRGSFTGEEIAIQRSQLESCIIGYLTESSKMMDLTFATNEARVMLQKNAMLELHNSTYYIVPRWVMIFRRIFNWRLSHLAHGVFSTAYIGQPQSDIHPDSGFAVNLKLETSISSSYNLSHPSLDEMVDLSFSPLSSKSPQPKMVVYPNRTPSIAMVNEVNERPARQNGGQCANDDTGLTSCDAMNVANESRAPTTVKEEGDKLSKLLENCNTLQNMIQEKLSIYF